MGRRYLEPMDWDYVEVEGSLTYQESAGAWNTLRLQKRLIERYPVLFDRATRPSYKWMLCKTIDKLEQVVVALKNKEDAPIPLLLFLYHEQEQNQVGDSV